MTKQRKAFGTWASPISARMVASSIRLIDARWDAEGETMVWLENRAGASALMMRRWGSLDAPRQLNESDQTVRGRIGYGGGEFAVGRDMVVYVGSEGRLYRQPLSGGLGQPITPAFGATAAPSVSPDGRWVVYVHEYEHNTALLVVDAEGQMLPRKLAFGMDFAMQPAWHPTGQHLAYVTWDHPQMPWDGTELRLATLAYDAAGPHLETVLTLAGGVDVSVFQPEFSPDGRFIAYASDETGWWQLYIHDLKTGARRQLTMVEAEHAIPAWVQGMRMFGWSADSKALYALRNKRGVFSLWRIEIEGGETEIPLPDYTHLAQISVSPRGERALLIASMSDQPPRIIAWEAGRVQPVILARASSENVSRAALSKAQPVTWRGHDGADVHGLYYPPHSEQFEGTGLPPLIVYVHGGPTSQVPARYEAEFQFFTSRGFAVLAVNHRGSTGYGKAYKDMHRGKWGVYDVEDSASGASALAARGWADPSKFVIFGGSAGGYTVLQSLVDKPGFYRAGVCLYGISNQFTLVLDATEKFEERYSDTLLGPLPDAAAVYRDRSPIFHVDRIRDPLILHQGTDDTIVPRAQSDSIAAALRARGVPHEYYVYEGEGHGFRKPETIELYLNRTLNFLLQHVIYG